MRGIVKKSYLLVLLSISITLIIGLTSYAVFSVNIEKKGVLNIVTGNLYTSITSNELDSNKRVVIAVGETKKISVTISNINPIEAKYLLYYKSVSPASLPSGVAVGYEGGTEVPPTNYGVNLKAYGETGSSKTYKIMIKNESTSSVTIELGSSVGLPNPSLSLPSGWNLITTEMSSEFVDGSGASTPELDDGMIPVVYDTASSTWKKADTSSEWYNYDKQNWANVVTVYQAKRATYLNAQAGTTIPMTDINTMWVWIPRYSYTIGNAYGVQLAGGNTPSKATPGAIDIKFVSKTDTLENGSAKYTGSIPTSWYTHPAFCFGTVDQGTRQCTGTETNGIWVAKFETGAPESDPCSTSPSEGNCNKSTLSPVSKPNMSSWRYAQVANMFTAVKNNMNGSNGAATYGFNASSGDSHMMKNMEWGAVTYLTQSKYGKYGNSMYTGANKEIYINNYISASGYGDNLKTITGCSSGTPSTAQAVGTCAFTYDKVADRGNGTGQAGAGASTTGNINGIYDMSGAGWEYVMGNFNGTISQSGFSSMPEAKYYDKYTGTTGFKGDATNADGTNGWYADYAGFVTSSIPWFRRGGTWDDTTNAGVFYFSIYYGRMYYTFSFRLVRAPLV